MQKIIVKINEEDIKLAVDENECYLLNSKLSPKFIEEFKSSATGKIVLTDDILLCKKLNLDGVIVDLSGTEKIKFEMRKIREELGVGKFLGVISRPRRHEAMVVSENEPDFIIFKVWKDGIEKIKELIDWYEEFFLLQLAIIPQDDDVDYGALGADIIILDAKKC